MIMTVAEALRQVTRELAPVAGEAARLEAEVLLAEVRKQSRAKLLSELRQELGQEEQAALAALVRRRLEGEPLAYLTGRREFMSLEFLVNPAVLIPRPETEVLVERALRLLAQSRLPRPTVVDVGTGCGNIALSLARYFPRARVLAVDLSPAALAVARLNAQRLSLARRVAFYRGDLLHPLLGATGTTEKGPAWRAAFAPAGPRRRRLGCGGPPLAPQALGCCCPAARLSAGRRIRVDLVVANLPYIPTGELAGLPPEVRREPRLALEGGADGLDLYRRLLRQVPLILRPGGFLVVEMSPEQEAPLRRLLAEAGLVEIATVRDAGGRPRVLSGKFLVRRGRNRGNSVV